MKQCIEQEDIDCVGGCEETGYCRCFEDRHRDYAAIHHDSIVEINGQRRIHSILEALINTVVGYAISVAANYIVLPWFGMRQSVHDALAIGLIFTAISIIRSYALRRMFNLLHVKGILQ